MDARQQKAETAAGKMASPAQQETDAMQTLRRFRLIFNAVKTHFQQVEKTAGIGGAQLWALGIVRDQPAIGIKGLAKAMDIHQSTASNLVKTLIRMELIDSRPDANDRRATCLHVLPAGNKVLRQAPGPLTGVLPEALGKLDAQTLRRLNKDLDLLIALLEVEARAAQVPLGQL